MIIYKHPVQNAFRDPAQVGHGISQQIIQWDELFKVWRSVAESHNASVLY